MRGSGRCTVLACFLAAIAFPCSGTRGSRDHIEHKSISIVTAARGCEATLPAALETWRHARGVTEIVIVDWSSEPPVAEVIGAQLRVDSRIKVVRVDRQTYWVLTWAYNLAATVVKPGSIIFKADCDTLIEEDFFDAHRPRRGEYFAGNYMQASNENERHLNGIFVAHFQDFWAINGFDERIQTYGWDDSDIYERFNSSRLAVRPLDYGKVHHAEHSNERRVGSQKAVQHPEFEIKKNRLLAGHLPLWGLSSKSCNFYIESLPMRARQNLPKTSANFEKTRVLMKRPAPNMLSRPRSTLTKTHHPAGLMRAWVRGCPEPQEAYLSADIVAQARQDATRYVLGVSGVEESCQSGMSQPYKEALMRSFSVTAELLTIHVQHGLGNRMRALASGLVVARATGRHLRVIWQQDMHMEALFGDLFENSLDVYSSFSPCELGSGTEVYNYMETEPNSQKDRLITTGKGKHIFVKTAYRLNHLSVTDESMHRALRELVPSKAVRRYIDASLAVDSSFVGVHMRNMDPLREISGMTSNEYTPSALAEMKRHRKRSGFQAFSKGIALLWNSDPSQKFFVCSDTPSLSRLLVKRFPKAHIVIGEQDCVNRSMRCVQQAVAQMYQLSKTRLILGSFWSSYTEVAGLLGNVKVLMADPEMQQHHVDE